jgi:hypothetical protein
LAHVLSVLHAAHQAHTAGLHAAAAPPPPLALETCEGLPFHAGAAEGLGPGGLCAVWLALSVTAANLAQRMPAVLTNVSRARHVVKVLTVQVSSRRPASCCGPTCMLHKGDEVQVHILLRWRGGGVTLLAGCLRHHKARMHQYQSPHARL